MKKMRKARLLAVCGTISILALLSTGTFSYFTTQAEVENSITTGEVSLQILQRDMEEKEISGDGQEIMPGDIVSYSAAVKNTGEEAVYLRVKLTGDVEGGVPDRKNLNAWECLKVEINETDWTLQDGYYYYNGVLEGGVETAPLFEKVEFVGENMDNAWLGKCIVLHVSAYGVQSANNAGSALEAFGWPEEADAVQ